MLPLAMLKAIVSSNCVVAKAVPLTTIIAMPMLPPKKKPPSSGVSEVGTSGNGNIQLKPRYWTLELLI